MKVRDGPASSDGRAGISALVDELSVAQKAGQLVGTYVGDMGQEITVADAKDLVVEEGVGTAAFGIGVSEYHTPERVAAVANELHRAAIEQSDHGIPLLLPVDAVHGHAYVAGAAIFPHGSGSPRRGRRPTPGGLARSPPGRCGRRARI